jgi:ribonuclease E
MVKKIYIDATYPGEIRGVVLKKDNEIEAFEYEASDKKQIKGNIYLAKVTRIEPSLQAAFVDYGLDKHGFLPFSEIHPSYYQIPISDRDRLREQYGNEMSEIKPPEITKEEIAEQNRLQNTLSRTKDDDDEIDISKYENDISELDDFQQNACSDDIQTDHNDLVPIYKQYKIQEVIKNGQVILVQVQKEERGNKGAFLTSFISLAGKYCVLLANKANQDGVSRKVQKQEERKRLKSIVSAIRENFDQKSSSLIIRTAGIERSLYEIKRDYSYLAKLWNKIREETLAATAPAFIHMEEGIIQRIIRDVFDNDVKEMIVEGDESFAMAQKFMQNIMPTEVDKIKKYKNSRPIFTYYKIEEQISNFYKPQVNLPSGGYIIINPTEALTAIDVNSGKSIMERNVENTALKNNLEAAKEISRQLRLRNISGLVVIDFIDMYELKHRKIIERSFKDFTAKDKSKIQICNISQLGLMELSRQRLKPSFLEVHSKICHHCHGKGLVRADESNSMVILRTIESEIVGSKLSLFNIFVHPEVQSYICNYKRDEIKTIEEKHSVKLNFFADIKNSADSFYIERLNLQRKNTNEEYESEPLPRIPLFGKSEQKEIINKKKVARTPKKVFQGHINDVKEDDAAVAIVATESIVEKIEKSKSKNFYKKKIIKKKIEPKTIES